MSPQSFVGMIWEIIKERMPILDPSGAAPVTTQDNGHICVDNSTMVPLDADEVFTGAWQDTLNYNIVIIGISSDKDSATDGLVIQWSFDGVVVSQADEFTILADTGKVFTFSPANQYVRLIYTNGSAAQGVFNLQTIFKKGGFKASSHRISDSIVGQDDAELTKAVLSGETPTGIFNNVKVSQDGYLTIEDNSSGLAIAEGNVAGKDFVHKFGAAPDFDTADGIITIWDGADDSGIDQMQYVYSTTAAIDSISSDNTGDNQVYKLQGLDLGLNLITQEITADGQNRVALTTPLYRIFRIKNAGATDNAGHIYVYENTTLSSGIPSDSAKVRSVIQPLNNQTLMAVYTIPAGMTGYLRGWYASTAGASKDSSYIIYLRARPVGGVFQLKHVSSLSDIASSHIQHNYMEPEVFAAGVDIEMRCQMTATGGSEGSVAAGFDIVLKDN